MILFVPSVLGAFLHSGISILAKASLPAYAMIILGILCCYMHYVATGFSHLQLYRIRPIVCIGLLQFNAVHSPGHLLLLNTQYCSFHVRKFPIDETYSLYLLAQRECPIHLLDIST